MSKQTIHCNLPVYSLKYWSGTGFSLPANSIYTLIIDYPFDRPGKFPIKTGKGMDLVTLLPHIHKAYLKQYKEADGGDGNGYWHGIEDLCIESIRVDHEKQTISLDVGS